MKVAYQGTIGAFSHQAALDFLPEFEPVAKTSFEDVIAAVESGETERGILPVENNEAGPTGARELIAASGVQVLAEHVLPIRMHLLGVSGAKLEQIRAVVSHPIALKQCARSIALLDVETQETSNTAVAAQQLSNPNRAVLASEAAARACGLDILKADMHDRPDNATTFAVLVRRDS
jgi:prephenate dehydratase